MSADPCQYLDVLRQRLDHLEKGLDQVNDRITGSTSKRDGVIEKLRDDVAELQVAVAGDLGSLATEVGAVKRMLWWFVGLSAGGALTLLTGLILALLKLNI